MNGRRFIEGVVSLLSEDSETIVREARARYEEMIPDLAYRERPEHLMAFPLFICTGCLAVGLSLNERGINFHTYGKAYLRVLADTPSVFDEIPEGDALVEMKRLAGESNHGSGRGEFVMDILTDDPHIDYAMKIKSCAICHQFRKYDAMELVPYMCAADDVFSARGGPGATAHGNDSARSAPMRFPV